MVFCLSRHPGLPKAPVFRDHQFSNRLKAVAYTCPKPGFGVINVNDKKPPNLWPPSVPSAWPLGSLEKPAAAGRHIPPMLCPVTVLSSVCGSCCLHTVGTDRQIKATTKPSLAQNAEKTITSQRRGGDCNKSPPEQLINRHFLRPLCLAL